MSHFCSITISFQYFPVIFDVNNFANTWENADMSAFDNFLRLRWSFIWDLGMGWAIPVPVPKVKKPFPLTPDSITIAWLFLHKNSVSNRKWCGSQDVNSKWTWFSFVYYVVKRIYFSEISAVHIFDPFVQNKKSVAFSSVTPHS